jgi:membrane protease YdiL (CAAX protease family)
MRPPGTSRLRGFGPWGLLSFVVLALASLLHSGVGALLVLVWAAVSGTPWRELGFVRPQRWSRTVLTGVVAGAAFKLAMKSVVMPLFGAPPINPAYHYLAGDRAAVPGFVFVLLFQAGFGEETVYRGYLFERLRRLLGSSPAAKLAIVLVTSALFAAAHYPGQGLPGVQQAAFTGLTFGTLYMVTGELPLIMILHAAFDLMAYALIYFGLETTVAQWFFR